jgi:hypothetical protein
MITPLPAHTHIHDNDRDQGYNDNEENKRMVRTRDGEEGDGGEEEDNGDDVRMLARSPVVHTRLPQQTLYLTPRR